MNQNSSPYADAFRKAAIDHLQACPDLSSDLRARLSLLHLYWTRLVGLLAMTGRVVRIGESEGIAAILVATEIVASEAPSLRDIPQWNAYLSEMHRIENLGCIDLVMAKAICEILVGIIDRIRGHESTFDKPRT